MAITQLTSYTAKNVGPTTSTVFTARAGVQTVINGLTVANVTNVATSASVLITRGGVDVYVVRNATVYPGGSMIVAGWDQKIALIAGDQLRAVSSVASSVDVFASAVLSGGAAAPSQPVNTAPGGGGAQAAGVYEQVSGTLLTLPSGVTRSTAQIRFGTASLNFAGTSALTYTFGSAFQTSAQGATIEAWIWTDPTTVVGLNLLASANSNGGGQSWAVGQDSGGLYRYFWSDGSSGSSGNGSSNAGLSAWHHIAMYTTNSTVQVWFDGTRVANQSTTPYPQSASKLYLQLGGWPIYSQWWKGFMSDVRVSLGDRYASAATITVPTGKLTADGTTLALIQAV